MSSLDQAVQTQLNNIQKKTGKSLEELAVFARNSGLSKHGELRDYFKERFGLGHGDANTLVHEILRSGGSHQAEGKNEADVLAEIYSGPKAALRPIHEALMAGINAFGEFEIAPKKGYLSLRRKKQFAMLGPATNTRFELGLNAKDLPADPRLVEQPKGSMCNYIVKLTEASQVDASLISLVKHAYEGAD